MSTTTAERTTLKDYEAAIKKANDERDARLLRINEVAASKRHSVQLAHTAQCARAQRIAEDSGMRFGGTE